MLELHYPEQLKGLPVARVLALFRSRHDEVQAFAAELLPSAVGVETLDVAEWLVLLSIDNPVALLFGNHIEVEIKVRGVIDFLRRMPMRIP